MTKPIARVVVLAAAAVVVQGCYIDFTRGHPALVAGAPIRSAAPQSSSSDLQFLEAFGSKPVNAKQPPTRLVARDGTSCVVSKTKYESTPLGTSIWCTWIDTNR